MIFSDIFFRPEDWLTATDISLCSYFFLDYLHFFLTSNVFIIWELQNAMTSCERWWHYDVTENTLLLKKGNVNCQWSLGQIQGKIWSRFPSCSFRYCTFWLIAVNSKWCYLFGDSIGILLTDRVCCENGRVIYFRDLEKFSHCIPAYS